MAKNKNNPNAPQNGEAVETSKEEHKEEKKGGNNGKEIVLKAYVHCQGCADKIAYILNGFEGVEEVKVDSKENKVAVKGPKADPSKVLERLQRKYSRNVELISPKPKPNNAKDEKEPEKKQVPQVKNMVLKMNMHCEGCAHDIKKKVSKMEGVLSVEADMKKSQVTVKGAFDPPKLSQKIMKQVGMHVEIIKQQNQATDNNNSSNNNNNNNNKKEIIIHYPPQNSEEYVCPSLIFSDENVFSCSIM